MARLLFLDESGQDQNQSPYEVLAGVAIEDKQLWPLIQAIQDLEVEHFGRRYADQEREMKAKKLLKRKTFRHASQLDPIKPEVRTGLAQGCLADGASALREEITALAQAKIAFCEAVLRATREAGGVVLAAMIPKSAPRTKGDFLRKDYAFIFERYFYLLEDNDDEAGLIVFDELERSQSHLLVDQMHRYFLNTSRGLERARLVVPEPFFVHSELTTGVQVADLVAYTIAWAVRLTGQKEPRRPEMAEFARLTIDLRYDTVRNLHRRPRFRIYGIARINDLRPVNEQELA
jgi:hypothetical protein